MHHIILSCVLWIQFLIRTNHGKAHDDSDSSLQMRNRNEFAAG